MGSAVARSGPILKNSLESAALFINHRTNYLRFEMESFVLHFATVLQTAPTNFENRRFFHIDGFLYVKRSLNLG